MIINRIHFDCAMICILAFINYIIHFIKPYIPILLTVCNNINMKNVIKFVKSVKLLDVKLLNQLNVL